MKLKWILFSELNLCLLTLFVDTMYVASSSEKAISSPSGKQDPSWKYVQVVNPNNINNLKCNFCDRVTKGGILRAKQHIVGGFSNATVCRRWLKIIFWILLK